MDNSGMTKRKESGVGRVYLLWAEDTDRFKIGYTGRSVGERAMAIEASSPWPLRVIADFPGTVADEQDLHIAFRKFNTHREWFALPESEVWKLFALFGITGDDVLERIAEHGVA